jgi:hypothetical protein
MARTVADAIASARVTLNDSDANGYRVSDATLIGFATDALNEIRNARPDLFLGNWGALTATAGGTLSLGDQYFRPLVDYLIARAEMTDDEHVLNQRAQLMATLMQSFLGR